MFGYFSCVKLCKCNVLDNTSGPQRDDRPHHSFMGDSVFKILREYIALIPIMSITAA